jgi:phospholipid/cholesterol/gamma-HCH transport system substrate-binding protein
MNAEPRTSRWRHFRAALGRQARGRSKDTIAIAVLAIAGIAMTLWIFTQQKASLPSWLPGVGEDFAHLTGEFSVAQAVTPGQGQGVDIAGIQVGKVTSVDLEEGRAVVGMDVEPEYLELIHPDATLLLRPKTNLNDMVVEVDPGSGKGHIDDGHNFPLSRTEPNVNLDAFFATLDADTRQYIQLLVAGGAEGIGGRGRQLSNAFRRFQPFVHYVADLNRAVAQRRRAIANAIHYFSLLTTELGRRDAQVERFVRGSRAGLANFANEQQKVQEALIELPATLAVAQTGFASSDRFSTIARPALLELIPQAQALGPAFDATRQLFEETTVPIRDQIRPFTRQIRPLLNLTAQSATPFERSLRGFGKSLGAFNSFLNTLAFKPKGSRESYLFYLPWVNHNINATYNLSDPAGPLGRGLVMLSCNVTHLAQGAIAIPTNAFLKTILQAANIPRPDQLPPIPPDPKALRESGEGAARCGPEVK